MRNQQSNTIASIWLLIASLLLVLLGQPVQAKPDADKPNIVILLADDLGIGDVSCYGSTKIKTPSIDSLAEEGVRFSDAHTATSVCTPSRYAMLTGRYYFRIKRKWVHDLLIDDGQPTIASVLKSAGYKTGVFGKWHLGFGREAPDYNEPLKPGPLEVGFDYFFGTPRSHNEPPFVFVENHHVYRYDPDDPIVMIPQEEAPKGKSWGYGISKGAEEAHAARTDERIDLIVADKACEFIAENKDQPFFAYVAFVAPHVPLYPAPEFKKSGPLGPYGDFIRQMDACVGKILKTLDDNGLRDNTMVIFSSDNGAIYHTGVHQSGHRSNLDYLGQKTDAWEGGHRVPFVVRWPGRVPEGKQCDRLISLVDMLATTAAAADTSVPDGGGPDSLNVLPLFEDPESEPIRTEMVYHGILGLGFRQDSMVYLPKPGSLGVTTSQDFAWAMQFDELGYEHSDFKPDGTLKEDAPEVQLYDLSTDPGQHKNLADHKPEKASELAKRLQKVRK